MFGADRSGQRAPRRERLGRGGYRKRDVVARPFGDVRHDVGRIRRVDVGDPAVGRAASPLSGDEVTQTRNVGGGGGDGAHRVTFVIRRGLGAARCREEKYRRARQPARNSRYGITTSLWACASRSQASSISVSGTRSVLMRNLPLFITCWNASVSMSQ